MEQDMVHFCPGDPGAGGLKPPRAEVESVFKGPVQGREQGAAPPLCPPSPRRKAMGWI